MVSLEDQRIREAADAALRVLNGKEDRSESATARFTHALRKVTREAPLHSLVIAFLLGVLIARRR